MLSSFIEYYTPLHEASFQLQFDHCGSGYPDERYSFEGVVLGIAQRLLERHIKTKKYLKLFFLMFIE